MTNFDPYSSGGNPNAGNVPKGTLKTLGGMVYQWNGSEWFNTGVRDETKTNTPLSFDEQMALATAPRSSNNTSSSVSQQISDPAALQAQRDIAAGQEAGANARNAATIQQQQAQLAASTAQAQAALQQQIQAAQQSYALGLGNLQFLKDKQTFADSIADKSLSLQAQQQVFAQQQAVAAAQLQLVGLQAQRDQQNAQIAQQNAQMANTVQQENVTNEANRLTQLQSVNNQVATEAANPGDRGKYASLVLANSGYGQKDAALANADLTSTASLTPLNSDLGLRDQLSKPLTPITFTPTAQLPTLDLSQIQLPTVNTSAGASAGPAPNYGITLPGGPAPASTLQQSAPDTFNTAAPNASGAVTAMSAPGTNAGTQNAAMQASGVPSWVSGFAPPAATGGIRSGAYLGDEDGDEIHIPFTAADGTPSVYVVPHDIVQRMKPGTIKALKRMADGGVFSGGSVFPLGQGTDTSAASNFIRDASNAARSGTPFATGTLPTPVYASSPGFDPIVSQLLDSLNAQSRGTPPGSYAAEAQRLAPAALTAGRIGRTA